MYHNKKKLQMGEMIRNGQSHWVFHDKVPNRKNIINNFCNPTAFTIAYLVSFGDLCCTYVLLGNIQCVHKQGVQKL